MECEHALGPSYRLSESDLQCFQAKLEATATDPELDGFEPVGWFHSHTRSEISLAKEDLNIFNRFFPEPGQVALVLRPNHFAPTRAGFFFREEDGSIRAFASLREFILLPLVPPAKEGEENRQVGPVTPPSPTVLAPAYEPGAPARYLPVRHTPENMPAREPGTPRRHGGTAKWVWFSIAACALIALAAGARHWSAPPGEKPVALRLNDAEGQLQIEWDRDAASVAIGTAAVIQIADGRERPVIELDGPHLRQGRVTYARRTGKVDVRIRVSRAGHVVAEEFAQFVGSPPHPRDAKPSAAGKPVEPAPENRQQLERQLEMMRAEMAQQAEEIRRLKQQPEPAALPAAQKETSLPARPGDNSGSQLTIYRAETSRGYSQNQAGVVRTPAPPRAEAAPAYKGPLSGRLIWTGEFNRGGTISVYGGHASSGKLTGQLPGVPVRIRVNPAEIRGGTMTVYADDLRQARAAGVEAPTAQNGNRRTVHAFNRRYAGGIAVVEVPGTQNAWRALTIRNQNRDLSTVVIAWEVVGK